MHCTVVTTCFLSFCSQGKFLLSLLNYASFAFITKYNLKQLLGRWVKTFFFLCQAREDKMITGAVHKTEPRFGAAQEIRGKVSGRWREAAFLHVLLLFHCWHIRVGATSKPYPPQASRAAPLRPHLAHSSTIETHNHTALQPQCVCIPVHCSWLR